MKRLYQMALAALTASSMTIAAVAGTFEITSFTIDGGGGFSAQDEWSLEGTIGQPDAGGVLSGDEWTVCGGFWPAAVEASELCSSDFDQDGEVDVSDLLTLLGAWGPCPPPCTPDIDDNGAVDVSDLLELLGAWGNCP